MLAQKQLDDLLSSLEGNTNHFEDSVKQLQRRAEVAESEVAIAAQETAKLRAELATANLKVVAATMKPSQSASSLDTSSEELSKARSEVDGLKAKLAEAEQKVSQTETLKRWTACCSCVLNVLVCAPVWFAVVVRDERHAAWFTLALPPSHCRDGRPDVSVGGAGIKAHSHQTGGVEQRGAN